MKRRTPVLLLLAAACFVLNGAAARASSGQETMLQDDVALFANPAATVTRLRLLGVDRLRVAVRWMQIAPSARSRARPAHFDATNPAAYPSRNWAPLDRVVREAGAQGLSLNFNVVGGAPLWATAPGAPHDGQLHFSYAPSAREFGYFMRALAVRYGGSYDPVKKRLAPGKAGDLPAVRFWSVWNEPNYGPSLAPQGAPGNLSVERSPWTYRSLLDTAWAVLHRYGHANDAILFGELAPRGSAQLGIFNGTKPLHFLRALYCVDDGYRELQGQAAALRGCPTNPAGSRRFAAAHPALFRANGFAAHPYSQWSPPPVEAHPDPDYASLAYIGTVERTLDRLQRMYGSRVRFPIWNTEYGYITSPPKLKTNSQPYIAPNLAAYYLNWAEYISWRDPRIKSFTQYLLADPLPAKKSTDYGGFASGLLTYGYREKPTYGAFRMPLYLPVTSMRRGRSVEVWGCARPAHWSMLDAPDIPDPVKIEFRPASGRAFKTLRTLNLADPHGYFDVRVSFPSSGTVRLSWTYPSADPLLSPGRTIYSRSVALTIK
ncbi:MAG: hypothetical protein JO179_13985 [Solirubrobacterales bacterium]|nr:hypothetical protein [Solirubrobacterales bacterium]